MAYFTRANCRPEREGMKRQKESGPHRQTQPTTPTKSNQTNRKATKNTQQHKLYERAHPRIKFTAISLQCSVDGTRRLVFTWTVLHECCKIGCLQKQRIWERNAHPKHTYPFCIIFVKNPTFFWKILLPAFDWKLSYSEFYGWEDMTFMDLSNNSRFIQILPPKKLKNWYNVLDNFLFGQNPTFWCTFLCIS